ncbi:hypothetical protein QIS74_04935 [Colletotrichum tabaci]|uniref:Uncharacterized protein n=1 Tax=Colletotrichum tabaci TaxID=1209068 RepID=A0AAV9THY2_9PEZI
MGQHNFSERLLSSSNGNVRRHPDISRLLGQLSRSFGEISMTEREFCETWDKLHLQWWVAANAVHRAGTHSGRRHHVLNWPAFLQNAVDRDRLSLYLQHAFARDFAAAKAKPDGTSRMRNAQAALDLAAPVDLLLVLGLAVCCYTGSLKAISSLRNAKGHEPVDADTITAAIRTKMLARHMLLPVPDHVAPVPTVAGVTEAVKQLRRTAAPRVVAATATVAMNTKKRGRAAKKQEQPDLESEGSRANISSSSSRSRSNKRRRTSRLSSDEVDNLASSPPSWSIIRATLMTPTADTAQPDVEEDEANKALLQEKLELCALLVRPSPLRPSAVHSPVLKAALETAENAGKTALMVAAGDDTVKSIAETSQWRQSRAGRGSEEEEE